MSENTPAHESTMREPRDTAQQPGLSTFMKVSIVVLTVVTVMSISLLFIGDFEGRFERVFSTLALFTVFVLLTMLDTRRDRKNDWYAPVALIANTYILGLLLIVIWVTPYDPFALLVFISWQSIYVIVVTRLVVWGVELLLRRGNGTQPSQQLWSQITSILGLLTLILFTAPLGIQAFQIEVPELFWKFAVAALILTGLGVAVTLLLSWFFRAPKPARQAYRQPAQYTPPAHPVQTAPAVPAAAPAAQASSAQPAPVPPASHTVEPDAKPQPVVRSPQQDAVTAQEPAQEQSAPREPLPWPTFADGSPLPVRPDGQPDFSALDNENSSKES